MTLARFGEANGRAVLNTEQVQLIFRLASSRTYSQRQIGEMFHIGQRTVVDILQKKTWAHLHVAREEEPA